MANRSFLIPSNILRLLALLAVAVIIVGLPYSLALMSMGSIGIAVVYLLEGNFKGKLADLKSNKLALASLAIFIWFAVSLLWTSNTEKGLAYLLKTLPLFSFPIVFSGLKSLRKNDLDYILDFFILTVLSVIIFYVIRIYVVIDSELIDPRKAIIFTSNVRLSLFICFGLLALQRTTYGRLLKVFIGVIFIGFLWFLQSFTAVFVFAMLAFVFMIGGFKSQFKNIKKVKWGMTLIAVCFLAFLGYTISDYYNTQKAQFTPELTANGTPYDRNLENGFIENGHYLWSNVCFKELEEGWKKETGKSVWQKGVNGFSYYSGIVRYLNNKGLTKDLEGLSALSEEDYSRILSGNPYPNEWKFKGFSRRIRGVLFYFEKSKISGDFTGNSLTEKLVYQRKGCELAKDNIWLGTGVGDFKDQLTNIFHEEYPDIDDYKIRLPHNQFISILGRTGVFGLTLFILILVLMWPKGKEGINLNLKRGFFIIITCSFMLEDTLENQAGITFFCLFLGLLFISSTLNQKDSSRSLLK